MAKFNHAERGTEMDTEQQGNNSWERARQFGRDLKQHWQWMLAGTTIGCAVASLYGGVAAPAAFGAGFTSHGWIYVGVTAFIATGTPALFYYLAKRQERDLYETE